MLFLWWLVTVLVFGLFSVQSICFIIMLIEYKGIYKRLSKSRRIKLIFTFVYNTAISLGWLILAFEVSTIRSRIGAVIVGEALCILFTIFQIPKMKITVLSDLFKLTLLDKRFKDKKTKLEIIDSEINMTEPSTTITKIKQIFSQEIAIEVFTKKEIINEIINLNEAEKDFSYEEYQLFMEIYLSFNSDEKKTIYNADGFTILCYEILSQLDLIIPIEKYIKPFLKINCQDQINKIKYRIKAKLFIKEDLFNTKEWHILINEFSEIYWNNDNWLNKTRSKMKADDIRLEEDELNNIENEEK